MIGEVISLLQSPIQRVLGALQNRPEAADNATPAASEQEATSTPETTNPEPTAEAAPESKPEA